MRKSTWLCVLAALAGLSMNTGAAAAWRTVSQYSNNVVSSGSSETVTAGPSIVDFQTDSTGGAAAAYVKAGGNGATVSATICRREYGGTTTVCSTGTALQPQANSHATPSVSTDTVAASTNGTYDFYYQSLNVTSGSATIVGHLLEGYNVP